LICRHKRFGKDELSIPPIIGYGVIFGNDC
jgi:hypothetical protein